MKKLIRLTSGEQFVYDTEHYRINVTDAGDLMLSDRNNPYEIDRMWAKGGWISVGDLSE